MKNCFRVIAPVALMVLAASCARELNKEEVLDCVRRYNLTFEEGTRTILSETGSKRTVSWNEGDEILYYTISGQSSAASATVSVSGSDAYVQIPRGRTDEFINAVYGATQLKSSSSTADCVYISSPVKNNQSYTSFSQAHVCAAFSDDIENPNLRFHNVAAIFKFTSSQAINKVVFHGNDNEIITGGSNGDLKISYTGGAITTTASTGGTSVAVTTNGVESDFYIAVIPVEFSAGISVDCYDVDNVIFVSKVTNKAINAASPGGSPKVLDLGKAEDWIASAPPTAVDLGLSVKWASFNVGATKPEEYGDYFAWGETSPKLEYKWANYTYGTSKNGPFSKYVLDSAFGTVDHKTILDLTDDAAHAAWGDDWRLPTKEEVAELMNPSNCTWTWTIKNGVPGYKVTSRKSGYTASSIFLPANGMKSGSSLSDGGTVGNYWAASISSDYPYYAISPFFDSFSKNSDNCYRYFGLGVRPVEGVVVPVASIEMPMSLDLFAGRTRTLSASVQPDNATYKGLTWASSDESIATVDAEGMVTAVSIGMATIMVYSADAMTTASCEVSVVDPYNGHEFVDLGLPSGLKWASCNLGANKMEEYGDYFAWGETEPKEIYKWSTYKWCEGTNVTLTKYTSKYLHGVPPDNKTMLDPEDDAARARWGGSWRMPTVAELEELRDNCTWTRMTLNGVYGMLATSKTTSNSLFLPATGYRRNESLYDAGSTFVYLSSSRHVDQANAWGLILRDYVVWDYTGRADGHSVRPVTE